MPPGFDPDSTGPLMVGSSSSSVSLAPAAVLLLVSGYILTLALPHASSDHNPVREKKKPTEQTTRQLLGMECCADR